MMFECLCERNINLQGFKNLEGFVKQAKQLINIDFNTNPKGLKNNTKTCQRFEMTTSLLRFLPLVEMTPMGNG